MPPLLPGFQAPRPQTAGPGEAKGELGGGGVGVEVRLHSLLWLHRDRTTACLGVYRQLAIQHVSALSVQLIDTSPCTESCLLASSHLSPCLINGTPFTPCQRVILCPICSRNPSITTITVWVHFASFQQYISARLTFKTSQCSALRRQTAVTTPARKMRLPLDFLLNFGVLFFSKMSVRVSTGCSKLWCPCISAILCWVMCRIVSFIEFYAKCFQATFKPQGRKTSRTREKTAVLRDSQRIYHQRGSLQVMI